LSMMTENIPPVFKAIIGDQQSGTGVLDTA
jgi:hypothetical protein